MSNLVPVTVGYGDGRELIMIDNRGVAQRNRVLVQGVEIVATEKLCAFDGQPGYMPAQGQ